MIKTIRCIIQFGFNLDREAVSSLCSVDRARRTKLDSSPTYDSFCKISKRFRSKIHFVFLFMVFSCFQFYYCGKSLQVFSIDLVPPNTSSKNCFDHRSFLNLNHSLIMYVESSAMSTNPPPSRSISLNSFLSWFSLYEAAAFFMNPKRPPPSPSSSPSYSASEIKLKFTRITHQMIPPNIWAGRSEGQLAFDILTLFSGINQSILLIFEKKTLEIKLVRPTPVVNTNNTSRHAIYFVYKRWCNYIETHSHTNIYYH